MKSEKWKHAMDEEIRALEHNNTWTIIDLERGEKIVGWKWIYSAK